MYLNAASAAWRYSGNVKGPDSMLSRPTTTGSPLAFFGVPSAAEASGVDVLEADLSLSDDEEPSLPQPAAKAPITATATMLVAHFLVTFMSLLMGWLVRRSPRRLRPDSWIAGGRAARAGPWRRLRARAGRGSARRPGRPPRARARRAAPRTARRRRGPPPRGGAPGAAA